MLLGLALVARSKRDLNNAGRLIPLPHSIATFLLAQRMFAMVTAPAEIQALTAADFTTPKKFTEFCQNGGKPLGGLVGGERLPGSLNATFQTVDPGSGEVLATVCEMGQDEVGRAVEAGYRAFHGDGKTGWKDTPALERIQLVRKLVELCERDRDVLLACEIRDGGKVSELAEGDFTQIRECAEYFCGVAERIPLGDSAPMSVAEGVKGFSTDRSITVRFAG
jgi:hypothetical protein